MCRVRYCLGKPAAWYSAAPVRLRGVVPLAGVQGIVLLLSGTKAVL